MLYCSKYKFSFFPIPLVFAFYEFLNRFQKRKAFLWLIHLLLSFKKMQAKLNPKYLSTSNIYKIASALFLTFSAENSRSINQFIIDYRSTRDKNSSISMLKEKICRFVLSCIFPDVSKYRFPIKKHFSFSCLFSSASKKLKFQYFISEEFCFSWKLLQFF